MFVVYGILLLVSMAAGLISISFGLLKASRFAIVAGSLLFALSTWLLAIH